MTSAAGIASPRGLTGPELVGIWERAGSLHPLDGALEVLATATAGASVEELSRIPLGERDASLLEVRRATLGDRLEARDRCAACGTEVEVTVSCLELLAGRAPIDAEWRLSLTDRDVVVRPVDSMDAAAAARAGDPAAGRQALLERVVVAGAVGSDLEVEAVARSIAEHDPLAEIAVELDCPGCGSAWTSPLDVAAFVLAELCTRGRRLLDDVDLIARAYGWSEREILEMPDARRATYVALAAGTA